MEKSNSKKSYMFLRSIAINMIFCYFIWFSVNDQRLIETENELGSCYVNRRRFAFNNTVVVEV